MPELVSVNSASQTEAEESEKGTKLDEGAGPRTSRAPTNQQAEESENRTKATARPRWRVGVIRPKSRAAPPKAKKGDDEKGGNKGKKKARKDEANKGVYKRLLARALSGQEGRGHEGRDMANEILSRHWRVLRREPPGHRRYENVTFKGRFVFEMPCHPEG